jgi:hypothetical protein
MSEDILLSKEKAGKFERLIERGINDEFGVKVNVRVKTNGGVRIGEQDSPYTTPDLLHEKYDDIYEALSNLDFSEGASSYEIVTTDRKSFSGSPFYLKRDGW